MNKIKNLSNEDIMNKIKNLMWRLGGAVLVATCLAGCSSAPTQPGAYILLPSGEWVRMGDVR